MTIRGRLFFLLAVPLMALLAMGLLFIKQTTNIEKQTEFANLQTESLSALGNILRCFAEARVNIRSHLLAPDRAQQARAEAALNEEREELNRLLRVYGTRLISSGEDRRLMSQFQEITGQWFLERDKLVALSDEGKR